MQYAPASALAVTICNVSKLVSSIRFFFSFSERFGFINSIIYQLGFKISCAKTDLQFWRAFII